MPAVVSNTSPLIILAKAGLMSFLPDQFEKVIFPNAVRDEILNGPNDDPVRKILNSLSWLEHVDLRPPLSPLAYWSLGRGESEVIEYARLHPGTAALLDDRAARRVAETMGIPVYGTLSIIAMQVLKEPALSFDHLVIRIQEAGLYLNKNLIESVRKKLEKR